MNEEIRRVPTESVVESASNPRKTFDQAKLAELAESLKAQGFLQPIVVRPLMDMTSPAWVHARERYEIVFGHRRHRAAVLAGLEFVDIVLRDMDDDEVAIAQHAENEQREGVDVIEAADSLAHMVRVMRISADHIAERLGMSRSYVYGRLKLAAASEKVRDAVRSQGLSPEIALEIARLRGDAAQNEALGRLRFSGGDWMSYRMAKQVVRGMFSLRITAAPFDVTGTDWDPPAPACQVCPKVSGNDPALADDVGADACMDRECWTAKANQQWSREIAAMRAEGKVVVEGDEAKAIMPYGPLAYLPKHYRPSDLRFGPDDDISLDDAIKRLESLGYAAPKPVFVVHKAAGSPPAVVELYTCTDAAAIEAAWRRLVEKREDPASTPPSAAQAQEGSAGGAVAAPDQRTLARWTGAPIPALRDAIVKAALGRPRTVDELRLVILRETGLGDPLTDLPGASLIGIVEPSDDDEDEDIDLDLWAQQRIADMSADDLAFLLVASALDYAVGTCSVERRLELARIYGIDPETAEPVRCPKTQDMFDEAACGGDIQMNDAPAVAGAEEA